MKTDFWQLYFKSFFFHCDAIYQMTSIFNCFVERIGKSEKAEDCKCHYYIKLYLNTVNKLIVSMWD